MLLPSLTVGELEKLVLPKQGKSTSVEKRNQKIRFTVRSLNDFHENQENGDALKRSLQILFWDVTSNNDYFTGLISEEAIRLGKKSKEHEYGASRFALGLMKIALERKITEEEVRSAMAKYMTWNYTTSEENTILRHNNQDYSKISKLVDYLQKGPF